MRCPKCGHMLWFEKLGGQSRLACQCGWLSETLESLVQASPAYRLASLKASGAEPGWYGPNGVACGIGRTSVIWRGRLFSAEEARLCGFVEVTHE